MHWLSLEDSFIFASTKAAHFTNPIRSYGRSLETIAPDTGQVAPN